MSINMETSIEKKLIAKQLEYWCSTNDKLIFDSSLCAQERIIRFATPMLKKLLPDDGKNGGVWKAGKYLLYEIYNGDNEFKIACTLSISGLSHKYKNDCKKLIESCGISVDEKSKSCFLKTWDYSWAKLDMDKVYEALTDFVEFEMPYFECELNKWFDNHDYKIKPFPNVEQSILEKNEIPSDLLIEGSMKDILTNRYERNPLARKKCIAIHGSSCKICGVDFGELYGPDFVGKIEVHHKKPLYEIKENYVVDPENDLIPVCPNCHMIIHSKKDGYYTVEEVMNMISSKRNK